MNWSGAGAPRSGRPKEDMFVVFMAQRFAAWADSCGSENIVYGASTNSQLDG